MIDYDPHRWWTQFLQVRGSMLKEITARVVACVVWAIAVCAVHLYWTPVGVPTSIHALIGLALSLLLVFRTNSSYDRFWEGRKLWGGIVNETRNLARASGVFLHADPELHQRIVRWTMCFPYAAAGILRGKVNLGPIADALPKESVARALGAQHSALAVSSEMSEAIAEGRRRGHYDAYVQMQLDQNVQLLIDYLGGCERIHKTPMPFAYMVHLRRALILYVYSLPFALVKDFGWAAVAATFAIAYVFFGIEEIGVEIEDPFGLDDNDLPLERICETIRGNLTAMIEAKRAA